MANQTHKPNTFLSMIVKCTRVSSFTFAAIQDKYAHFCHYSCVSGTVFK